MVEKVDAYKALYHKSKKDDKKAEDCEELDRVDYNEHLDNGNDFVAIEMII